MIEQDYGEILKGEVETGKEVIVIDERSDDRCTGTAELTAEKRRKINSIKRLPYVGVGSPPGLCGPGYKRLFAGGVEFYPFTSVKVMEGSTEAVYNIYSKEDQRIDGVDTIVLVGRNDPTMPCIKC